MSKSNQISPFLRRGHSLPLLRRPKLKDAAKVPKIEVMKAFLVFKDDDYRKTIVEEELI